MRKMCSTWTRYRNKRVNPGRSRLLLRANGCKSDSKTVGELRKLASWRSLGVRVSGLAPYLLTFKLLSQLTLKASLFPGLHIEGVFLDFLDNAFLLNLSLESPKCALNGLSFEHRNFRD